MKIRLKDLDKFNEILLRKGYSKSAYSDEIGLSRAAGSRLCSGKAQYFSPSIAAKTAETLEVGFDDIFKIVK